MSADAITASGAVDFKTAGRAIFTIGAWWAEYARKVEEVARFCFTFDWPHADTPIGVCRSPQVMREIRANVPAFRHAVMERILEMAVAVALEEDPYDHHD